jgi:hypothetical protein
MPEFDLFVFFRSTLVVFFTIYSVLLLCSSVWRLVAMFRGIDQTRQMLRLYVSYQLLTIQPKPVRGELVQIAFWLLILGGLSWSHALV